VWGLDLDEYLTSVHEIRAIGKDLCPGPGARAKFCGVCRMRAAGPKVRKNWNGRGQPQTIRHHAVPNGVAMTPSKIWRGQIWLDSDPQQGASVRRRVRPVAGAIGLSYRGFALGRSDQMVRGQKPETVSSGTAGLQGRSLRDKEVPSGRNAAISWPRVRPPDRDGHRAERPRAVCEAAVCIWRGMKSGQCVMS